MATQGNTLSKKEQTHQRILATAAKMIRRDGFEALAVAEVMKQAGLTHGGFYAHFANRDALLAEALAYAGADSSDAMETALAMASPLSPLQIFVDAYLSEQHLFAYCNGAGCPVAALGGEFHRLDPQSKTVAAKVVDALVDRLEQLGHGALSKAQAFLISSTLVGVIQLARTLERSEALKYLESSRQLLLALLLSTGAIAAPAPLQ
jgi:TetR/AcrR family transcriptional regulator, transcriptional repressor for nem operon